MSHRRTKEELDEQFEQFLKESVSDDSVDLGGVPKRPSVLESLGKAYEKPARKPAASLSPWWQHDDDSDRGPGRARKRRFIKANKSQAENTEEDESKPRKSTPTPTQAVGGELPPRPASPPHAAPRSKAPRGLVQSDEARKCDLEEASQTADDSLSPRGASGGRRSPDDDSYGAPPSASSDTGSLYSSGDGLLGSGSSKSFLKSLRKSQSIQEEAEEQRPGDQAFRPEEGTEPALICRDSLEAEESVMASGPAVVTASVCMDTLEEEEEKARFFARLEAEATSSIDYSQLNRELDSTMGTNTGLTLRKVEQAEEDKREDRFMETDRSCPASPHYSEDFEDEGSGKETPEEKPERPPLPAKVSLDSLLDSIGRGPTPAEDEREPVDAEAVLPAGQSYGQSGGSEIEALHEAYRNISHSAENSEDHRGEPRPSSPQRSGSRPSPPTSPPERASRGTLQHASTTESELPTAEELMRPIRPEMEHIRGFTLQPATGVGLYPDKADVLSEKRSPGCGPEQRRPVSAAGGQRETGRPGGPPPPPPPSSGSPPLQALTWNVREEMERLMQEQEDAQASKDEKQQAPPRGPSLSGPPTSSARKPSVAPARGRRVEGRPTTAARFSRPGGASLAQSKPQAARQASHRSPGPPIPRPRPRPTEDKRVSHRSPGPKPRPTEDAQEVQASRELIAFLQHQIDTGTLHIPAATQDSQQESSRQTNHAPQMNMEPRAEEEEAEEERPLVGELRAQLAQKDKELLLREERLKRLHGEELSSLRQENYVLQSKLSVEGAAQRRRWAEAADPVTQEKLRLIEKETQEQETLIQGYQQENEKLYLQMKAQQAKTKANEEAMFTENQRLLIQLASAKEQVNKTPRPMGNVCSMGHTQRITDLLAQIETFQGNEAKLMEETQSLQQEKAALEEDLQLMKKEKELAQSQLGSTSGDKSFETRAQEDGHREEVSALQKNQEDGHREEVSALQKKQEDGHREEVSALQKKQEDGHRAEVSALQKKQEDGHREEVSALQKKQEDRHREEVSALQKKQEDGHRAEVSALQKKQEDGHREEVTALQKKLQWYAENQELLDRDAARLRAATAQTHKLKEQVEKLKAEVGRRGQQQQTKARERAADAKRIQDLERQVKELEQTLRRRHPNSLPALIHAAAAACGPPETQDRDPAGAAAAPAPPSQVNALLERRVQRLEAELESCDEEAQRGLRAMDQRFQRIKLQYEHQISQLEQQLTQKPPSEPVCGESSPPRGGPLQALELELELEQQLTQKPPSEPVCGESSPPRGGPLQALELEQELEQERVKQAHRATEQALRQQVQSLLQQLAQKQAQQPKEPERVQQQQQQRSPSRRQRGAEEAFGARIERLNQELAAKTRSIQELSRTVERLQRERRGGGGGGLLSGPSPRRDARRQAAPPNNNNKTPPTAAAHPGVQEEEETAAFPPAQHQKAYRPTEFSGSHITEVLQENEALRESLERLRLQAERREAELQDAAARARAELCSLKEHSAEQLSILKGDHQRELQQLCANHALGHSRTKVAELTNKLATQEVVLQQLREQLNELQETRDALAVSRVREDTLQNQLTRLLGELKRAGEAHSPELKHFLSLERKIHSMALRHTQREKELQQLLGQTRQAAAVPDPHQAASEQRWRLLAQGKSRELEAFRLELDSILDVLRELQRQGVVIPAGPPDGGGVPFTWRS